MSAEPDLTSLCQPSNTEAAPEAVIGVLSNAEKRKLNEVIKNFNSKYSVVVEGGKTLIFKRGYDEALDRNTTDRSSFLDLRNAYSNDSVKVAVKSNGEGVYKTKACYWLDHPQREQFLEGVTFDPSGKKHRGKKNLWQGFRFKPSVGDWSLLKAHILEVICSGDEAAFGYLMGWLARMFQLPDQQGEVAVVLRSGEGTGKGTLAKALLKIMGQHGMAVSNAKHLVGNFNQHLRDCVFLFADEAFFAGDKQSVGVLNSLITEELITIEAKYANAIQQRNFLHVLMASNEEWVIPASIDARRFFVLEVGEARKNDHAYFGAIWAQMEAGGYAAMLGELLAFDLAKFNVRAVPQTEALNCQRKLSLSTTDSWWSDCLARGYVFQSKLGLEDTFGIWMDKVATELLFASYITFAKSRNERHPLTRETLGKYLVGVGARPGKLTKVPINESFRNSREAPVIGDRAYGYYLGSLEQARTAFTAATKISVAWDGGAGEELRLQEAPPVPPWRRPSGTDCGVSVH